MIVATLVIGSPGWWPVAVAVLVLGWLAVWWSYRGTAVLGDWARTTGIGLKLVGVALLAFCLVEPLWSGQRARPGENLFLVLADDSRSLAARDDGASKSRGEELRRALGEKSAWRTRLETDFDTRSYVYGEGIRRVPSFEELAFEGRASRLHGALASLRDRHRGRPVAGILVFGDGNATDVPRRDVDTAGLPPVYPVVVGRGSGLVDIAISHVAVSETSFEDAPITVRLDATTLGIEPGEPLVARLVDEQGETIAEETAEAAEAGRPASFRFEVPYAEPGVRFLSARVGLPGELDEQAPDGEATYANNARLVRVYRRRDPQRILYVSGRPNWEFKFVNRALADEDQLALVGLVRIANREPKFDFRSRDDESSNPLFRGFAKQDADTERYDEAVTIRLNVSGPEELAGGRFPEKPADLYRYDAIVLDDVEKAFFSADQLDLLSKFVSVRGGGLLVLGGAEALADGNWAHTPVADALPVFLDGPSRGRREERYRLALSRDGWLQPWVRLRDNEAAERARIEAMPEFRVLNHVGRPKPGAIAMAHVRSSGGETVPALVVQRYGRGRSAVLTLGDTWRWHMHREEGTDDHHKAWRQMLRWLVADVPAPVEVGVETSGLEGSSVRIRVTARDADFEPRDGATVALVVTPPQGEPVELLAEPSLDETGVFEATYVPRLPGAYRVSAKVADGEGRAVGTAEGGWAHEPDVSEFASLAPREDLLARLAERTGGRVLRTEDLDEFTEDLAFQPVPVMEHWTYPLWQQGWVFLLAVACLAGEWGLRRWRGLP